MLSDIPWQLPPNTLHLERAQVHVWRIVLDVPTSSLERYWHTLTGDEKIRAERFYFARDRNRYIANRGLLRKILSGYLDCEPAQLRFCYSAHGKPFLSQPSDEDTIHFSVSHSNDLGLIAIMREHTIGVDLEYINPACASMTIAEQCFNAHEVALLRTLPPGQRIKAFYNCWTRKEAFVKAQGLGLSLPLKDFEVSLIPGEPAQLLRVNGDQTPEEWSLRELVLDPDYAAALAVHARNWQLDCWTMPTSTVRPAKGDQLSKESE